MLILDRYRRSSAAMTPVKISMRFKEYDKYFCKIEHFLYGENNERSFSNPHPRAAIIIRQCIFVPVYVLITVSHD